MLGYLWVVLILFKVTFVHGQAGFPYCESFQSTSLRNETLLGGNARLAGGVLQLTQAVENQNGYVYIDIPFSASFGIKASFEYFMHGGNGADGMTMFLFNAATNAFSPGAFGGSLGYAQGTARGGLSGAYMGIGLDLWGNFGNQAEGKVGGFPGAPGQLHPNSVVVRGPASNGYAFVAGRKVGQGGDLAPADQFSIASGAGRVTNPNAVGYRQVFIELKPATGGTGFLLTMEMQVTTVAGSPRMVTLFEDFAYPYAPPPNLKIGFTASTGGFTNFHEIRNLLVEVAAEDDLQVPQATDISGLLGCAGQASSHSIGDEDVFLPNENSTIQCVRLYRSLQDIPDEEDDLCSEGVCGQRHTVVEVSEGVIQVDGKGTGFVFLPFEGTEGRGVEIYYTVTDNYGKTSEPKRLLFEIQGVPPPVEILVDGLPLDAWSICPGEEVTLSAIGAEDYVSFEWYRFGESVASSGSNEFVVKRAGEYEVWAYNALGCPAKSSTIIVDQPPFPSLTIESPIVACHPEASVDIREYIADYDQESYDYRVVSADGVVFVNEEMFARYTAGVYLVSVKQKGTSCWSEGLEFWIRVVQRPVDAAFEYGIDGTDRIADDDGFVLTMEPIWFRDRSTGAISGWSWDFGDGNTSRLRNPVHVYGQKGDFLVTLTIRSEGDCESVAQMNITIHRSYRIMFPTGFTPTSAQNTHFRPKTKGIARMELLVFNVWGELLFRSEDLNTDGWDGNVKGKDAPPGTYVYRANFVAEDGEEIVRTGKFLMVR